MDSDRAIKDEKKRILKGTLTILFIVGLIVAVVAVYGIYWLFYDLDRLPQGDFLTEETSPNGTYTVKAYVTDEGATVSYAVRGELIFNEKDDKVKTIYWSYREESVDITWKDDDTVIINGHTLDVPGDTFDFRHD